MTNPQVRLAGRFFDLLLRVNPELAGFKQWLFHPGMLFHARRQWWGREQPRPNPHEGLDLCWFEDGAGKRRTLAHTTLVPAPYHTRVVKILPDFLGQSIILAHTIPSVPGRRLLTAFGHTAPLADLAVGQRLQTGDILAAVAPPVHDKIRVPPHLHLTLALIPENWPLEQFNWNNFGLDPSVLLLDPLKIFPTNFVLL